MNAPSERRDRYIPDPSELNMGEFLSALYIPQTTYADRAWLVGDTAFVEYEVKEYHCDPAKKPSVHGTITREGNVVKNMFVVDKEEPFHTEGHFNKETGIQILQAHLADGAMIAAGTYDNPALWLVSIRNISHFEPGLPGDTVGATMTILEESEDGGRVTERLVKKGVVSCNDRVHTRGFDLRFEEGPLVEEGEFFLPQHALFEIGAQAAGGAIKLLRPEIFEQKPDEPDDQKRALVYSSKGGSQFEKVIIRPRDHVTSKVTVRRTTTVQIQDMTADAAYVDVVMSTQNGPLATVGNLGLGFVPADKLKAGIDRLKRAS